MSLHTPDQHMMHSCKCHICREEIRLNQNAIEHSGHGQCSESGNLVEGYTTIWMHPECATVLALRLAHDVMKIKSDKDQPKRVVDELQALAHVNLVR